MSESTTPTVNPAREVFDLASHEKRLGSRISRKQLAAVLETDAKPDIEPAVLGAYAVSGDDDQLTDAQRIELRAFVSRCKGHAGLTTDSQRRRLWPRKVAAILSLS